MGSGPTTAALALLGTAAWVGALEPDQFAQALPRAGAPPLLLALSRPGCDTCTELAAKWPLVVDRLGPLATVADINCTSATSASGVTIESFCFGLQTRERDTMHFPRLLLFTAEGSVYSLPKSVYMAGELVKTVADVVKGSYREKAHREGSFNPAVDCPAEDGTCMATWLPDGVPFTDSCKDLLTADHCSQYQRQDKCQFFQEACEVSCGVCRPVPGGAGT